MVIWIIGLSGAGKSVIGGALFSLLKEEDPATVLVDGDEIRRIFRHDLDENAYSKNGRKKNAERIREICKWLDLQGINVVCCLLSIFEESHVWNRENYEKYFEVYISAPIQVLVERDNKDLYARAFRGDISNVAGVDIEFVPPSRPDMTIENGAQLVDVNRTADSILRAARKKFGK